MTGELEGGAMTGLSRVRRWAHRSLAVSVHGLPGPIVLWWFPALALIATIVLTALQISGTSSGSHWRLLESGPDPRLISGEPRDIRSDEWLVAQSWTVAQAHRDYPAINPLLPGGVDMSVLSELPNRDWSTAFRPHLWGHLLFGLDVGAAWAWWVPSLAVLVSGYLLAVTLMPRRPFTSALLAVGVLASPILQWWYTATTAWAVAWPLLAMAGFVWVTRHPSLGVRIAWSAVIGYTAVTMVMGLYVPFMLPGVFVFLAFCLGWFLQERRPNGGGAPPTLRRLIPLAVAALIAVAVILLWIRTHADTFEALAGTVYPGTRSVPTGRLWKVDPHLVQLFGAPWNELLRATPNRTMLGRNSSEGSTAIAVGIFLIPALIYVVVRRARRERQVAWVPILLLALLLVIAAVVAIPGWGGVAHYLLLDRSLAERWRLILVPLFLLVPALVMSSDDRDRPRFAWVAAVLSGLLAAACLGSTWFWIRSIQPWLLPYAPHWKVLVAVIVIGCALIPLRRLAPAGVALLVAATIFMSWGINPAYRGVFDLSSTTAGRIVHSTDDTEPGGWVAVGSPEAMAILMQSASRSYSGVQFWPILRMWDRIDSADRYEREWNRLAHIQWKEGEGSPVVTNPSQDIAEVTFDSCARFAQRYVRHVISTVPLDQPCLTTGRTVRQGPLVLRFYDVVARPAA